MTFRHDTLDVQFNYPKMSKPIIDQIDELLAAYFEFSDDELGTPTLTH